MEAQYKHQLQFLDFSNTGLNPKQLVALSQFLKNNLHLTNLSLAFNSFDNKQKQIGIRKNEDGEKFPVFMTNEEIFTENMAHFISRSQHLIHLNLSRMNLSSGLYSLLK